MLPYRLIISSSAFVSVFVTAPPAAAQPPRMPARAPTIPHWIGADHGELYRLVKHFDFDERKLGNYEDIPMHWTQLRGSGLPALYANGRFDDDLGREAPPSFRLDIATGSVAYEYGHLDLIVVPQSDYLVRGYVRAEGLVFARAFVAAYLVDEFGERLPGSERISKLVRSVGGNSEPWQKVEIMLPGAFPSANALRIQFWILQTSVWREPNPGEVDPIIRRDVYGTAWFDDFSVYRLPAVHLRFSNPAGLVLPGHHEEFILVANNATSQPLEAELSITDSTGRQRYTQKLDVPAFTSPGGLRPAGPSGEAAMTTGESVMVADQQARTATVRAPVPELPPGLHHARLRLLGGTATLLERTTDFLVLPELTAKPGRQPDIGVDLGRWQRADIPGLLELLHALGCGVTKIGIPMLGVLDGEEQTAYFQQLSTLLRVLGENLVDTTGVILAPSAGRDGQTGDAIRELVKRDDGAWRELFSPVLAHFGGMLPAWQLGAEEIELRGAQQWQPADIERVRSLLRRFVTIPMLVVPQPITAVTAADTDIVSVWVPASLPTRWLPRQLGFLVNGNASAYWLQLATDQPAGLSATRRTNDLARRLVLAKALGPGRVFIRAPFHVSRSGGQPAWQPTEDYLVLRTLLHYLSGRTAVAAITPAADTIAIAFEDADSSCMVIWSWQDQPSASPVALYLGPSPWALTIWGERVPLRVKQGQALLPVGPTPLIIENLHTPLVLLQASYRISPTYVQLHEPEPRPTMTFRNPYDTRLSGEVRFTPSGSWQVEPPACPVLLEPGMTFRQPLTLTLPPGQIAEPHQLDVYLMLHAPENAELHFLEALTIGLRNVSMEATAYWDQTDLVVEHSLRNSSNQTISFTAFCEPPGLARAEGAFLDIGPGELGTQTYVFPSCRHLAGAKLHMGIREIGGDRSLNQFAEIPR